MDTIQYRGTGRRKKSIAQVRLLPGLGNRVFLFAINCKNVSKKSLFIIFYKFKIILDKY